MSMAGLVPWSFWSFGCHPCYLTPFSPAFGPGFPTIFLGVLLRLPGCAPCTPVPSNKWLLCLLPPDGCVLISGQVAAAAMVGPHLLWPVSPHVRCNPRAKSSPANERLGLGPGAVQLLALCFSAVCLVIWPSAPRTRARALAPHFPSPVIWLQNAFSGSSRKSSFLL